MRIQITKFMMIEEKKVNAKIFLVTKNFNNETIKNEFIVCFLDYNPVFRIHINLDGKLIGTPEYGNSNYQLKNNILTIYNDQINYENGLIFHPFLKDIDLKYNFYSNRIVFNSFEKIKDKSKYYIIEIP
jgi:hypothetical protein